MSAPRKKGSPVPPRTAKVSKTYRLSPEKIAAAQRALGAATATETIETALDLVIFQQGLIHGTRALLGVQIDSSDAAG